ncbi:four helix bundle protein [Flagellimonas taeanensis]|uniref:four helix bundle protein n=1 Tax=Flavobacteriaceae TaxID=49546 RepID=UPI000E6949A9|nr:MULTISPECIES: four helix bundle protein [Allomuricauda]MDC6385089.1 four helix bundle protein [Muricauda sp. SK9]RIV48949.1 four helix bundle protein [Allomuricauda taeanensis]
MAVQRFEDLIVWQKAQELAVIIYNDFHECKDFGFRDQIRKASVSVSNNIAEGFERSSNADFSKFLFYALGSNKLNLLAKGRADEIIEVTHEVSKLLYGLIKSMKTNASNS